MANLLSVSFTYRPQILPFYNSSVCSQLEQYIPFSKNRNQEILIIGTLKPGLYQLFLDGKPAGVYSSKEWEKGVNIANLEENPNQARSAELYRYLCTDWYEPMHNLRRLAYQTERCIQLGISPNLVSEYGLDNKQSVDPAFLEFCGNNYKTIITLFQQKKENERKLKELQLKALQITPCQYHIEICRISY